mmetsp:Transcript_96164/g.206326  ORF Transcript_96164/g.206326 Transcript_96164/m.206326 type:complete len:239 (+) Transcript_96164:92-808(+)
MWSCQPLEEQLELVPGDEAGAVAVDPIKYLIIQLSINMVQMFFQERRELFPVDLGIVLATEPVEGIFPRLELLLKFLPKLVLQVDLLGGVVQKQRLEFAPGYPTVAVVVDHLEELGVQISVFVPKLFCQELLELLWVNTAIVASAKLVEGVLARLKSLFECIFELDYLRSLSIRLEDGLELRPGNRAVVVRINGPEEPIDQSWVVPVVMQLLEQGTLEFILVDQAIVAPTQLVEGLHA